MYKYYNKSFRISRIYRELLIHFIFSLKFIIYSQLVFNAPVGEKATLKLYVIKSYL